MSDQVRTQLARTLGALPRMQINPKVSDLFSFTFEDFELVDYVADPTIRAPLAKE